MESHNAKGQDMGAKKTSMRKQPKRRLLLIDHHPILRDGLAHLILAEPDLEVCGQIDNSVRALYEIAALKPHLIILEIALKSCNGLDLIKRIKTVYAELPVLAFSVNDEFLYAERALRAGALGYLMKQSPREEVVLAIRRVLGGERYLSMRMQERMMEKLSPPNGLAKWASRGSLEQLSDRELEVFQLIGNGSGTRQIAEHLRLSIKTVETYRAHIKQKLHLRNGMELIRTAMEMVN